MNSIVKVGDRFDDNGIKNKFVFAWLQKTVTLKMKNGEPKEFSLGDFFKKVDVPGKCMCIICDKLTNYGSRGCKALESHCETTFHLNALFRRKSNYTMESMFGAGVSGETKKTLNPKIDSTCVPMCDRVSTQEALILAVIAENSLPLSIAPTLVKLCQTTSRDKPALSMIALDRTTASYKMTHGLGKSFAEETVQNLNTNTFSLNIDESTAKNLKRMLSILASYYFDGEIRVEHLSSVEVIKVDALSIFNAVSDLFESRNIPWSNCVSILLDSCNVMRGSKNGFEQLVRSKKANHLLDIDGDSCHHIHNSCKQFCAPFDKYLETLFSDIYSDFKWSSDLRDYLNEICSMVGVKSTMPERFISHRWLSAYDRAVDTTRLFVPLLLFYYPFIGSALSSEYKEIIDNIYVDKAISDESIKAIEKIHASLRKKSLTEDGKSRKLRIIEKLFFTKDKTILQLEFYASVLSILKAYVCLFQTKETLIHQLHDKQLQTFKEFLTCFVKSEAIVDKSIKSLKKMNVEDEKLLNKGNIFYGRKASSILEKLGKKDFQVREFKDQAQKAYVTCAKYMQKKLPLDSDVLKSLSCIDPLVRNHHITGIGLNSLARHLSHFISSDEQDIIISEIRRYQVDDTLPAFDYQEGKLVEWWSKVFDSKKYPTLTKVVKPALSIFHGPQVESSFNIMGDIIDMRSTRINTETFNAVQSIKYALRARNTTGLKYFDRTDPVHSPVHQNVCRNLRSAASRYKKEKEMRQQQVAEKKEKLNIKCTCKAPISKQKTKAAMAAIHRNERLEHELREQKISRKRALEELAEKFRKKRNLNK